MRKKIIIILFLISLSTSVFSLTYWISKFFTSITFTTTGPTATLQPLNISKIDCDCNIYTIDKGYSTFTVSNPLRDLFIAEWNIDSENPLDFRIDISRTDIDNTTAVLGIGYFDNGCSYNFEDLTNISFTYDNKQLCIYSYSYGSYESKTFYDINEKNVVVFLWIPSVGEKTTISLKSGVYLIQ